MVTVNLTPSVPGFKASPSSSWDIASNCSPATEDSRVETLRGVAQAEVAAILGGNAVRFYEHDAEKLAPIEARIGPDQGAFE